MTTDIFIKTFAQDYPWLDWCLRSIKRFGSGYRRIVVVIDDRDPQYFPPADVAGLPVVITRYPCPENDPRHQWGPAGTGYNHQKVVKLRWGSLTDANSVFQIDSDTILVRPTDFRTYYMHGDRPVWHRRKWALSLPAEREAWQAGRDMFCSRIHVPPSEWNYMIEPGFRLTRAATSGFLRRIKQDFAGSAEELFLDPALPRVSVYNTFGIYLENTPDHAGYSLVEGWSKPGHTRTWWSWAGLNSQIVGEITEVLRG